MKSILIIGLITAFVLLPFNVEGSTGLDQLHEDIQDLRQDIQQQKCEEQTGNITGCAIDRLDQDAADYLDKLIDLN